MTAALIQLSAILGFFLVSGFIATFAYVLMLKFYEWLTDKFNL